MCNQLDFIQYPTILLHKSTNYTMDCHQSFQGSMTFDCLHLLLLNFAQALKLWFYLRSNLVVVVAKVAKNCSLFIGLI